MLLGQKFSISETSDAHDGYFRKEEYTKNSINDQKLVKISFFAKTLNRSYRPMTELCLQRI